MMSDRIKKIRKELNLTQQQLANVLGIKRNTIATYESGRNEPIDAVISLMCKELHVNETWLRTGDGEMFCKESRDEIDALAKEYNLSEADALLIKRFVKLDPDLRAAFLDFVVEVADDIESTRNKKAGETAKPSEIDIDAAVEDYRRQLEEQKKAAAGSSASDGGKNDDAAAG